MRARPWPRTSSAASSAHTNPRFAARAARALAEAGGERHEFAGGRLVTTRHASTTCPACAETLRGRPPAFCTACGAAYEPDGMQHQADEVQLAYTCTCPAGHTVSGINAV